jgi:multisubunit Na+/H+ antiporter MnhB subunit
LTTVSFLAAIVSFPLLFFSISIFFSYHSAPL